MLVIPLLKVVDLLIEGVIDFEGSHSIKDSQLRLIQTFLESVERETTFEPVKVEAKPLAERHDLGDLGVLSLSKWADDADLSDHVSPNAPDYLLREISTPQDVDDIPF